VLVKNFADQKGIAPERIWQEMDGMSAGGDIGKFKSKSGNFWNLFQRHESGRVKSESKNFSNF
jgi:hypothetical protein